MPLVRFDERDRHAEQDAGRHEGRHDGGRKALLAEQNQAQRDAHETDVRIGIAQGFDADVGQGVDVPRCAIRATAKAAAMPPMNDRT